MPINPAVLIVEPHHVTRELYVRELAQSWPVLACGDRADALELMQREAIGAIVLEPVAPGEEFWSLLAEVRANAATATVPVVICSVVDERRRGLDMGANAYLVKPVSPQQLVREVARWLQPRIETQFPK